MKVTEVLEEEVLTARAGYLVDHPPSQLHHLTADIGALWPKLDHLLYFPILGLTRPRDLYYYQGAGLAALYGFTYKYMTMEHFLGQLTRVRIGAPLAARLAFTYAQAWYPGDDPLTIFADWHVKPHWTKAYSHAGHVTMWGRVMPGTKQMIINGPQGRLLGGWNYPIDTHMSRILVEMEAGLAPILRRPVGCTVTDSEGGGLPLGERYAEAEQNYISVLHQERAYRRADFELEGPWEAVKDDPDHQAAFARWADAERAAADPRQFVLLRPSHQGEPTRIYTGRFAEDWSAGEIPWRHRLRWANNELRIRDLIQGTNLNANFGYTYTEVPNRTRQRVDRLKRELKDRAVRFRRRQRKLLHRLSEHEAQARQLRQRRAERIATRDAIDTETLCQERDLEKDQIMLNFQILLTNLHDWVAENYFAPEWRTLSLEKATQMIYRKAGRVTWQEDRIEVELEPYRYADQQRAMEATCARFNATNPHWRDGRALRITVAAAD